MGNKIKIKSDGTIENTKIVDQETGKELQIVSLSLDHNIELDGRGHKFPVETYKLEIQVLNWKDTTKYERVYRSSKG